MWVWGVIGNNRFSDAGIIFLAKSKIYTSSFGNSNLEAMTN